MVVIKGEGGGDAVEFKYFSSKASGKTKTKHAHPRISGGVCGEARAVETARPFLTALGCE